MSSTERTFVINFRVVPVKVKYSDISSFIVNKLGFESTQIKHLQITNGRVFVGTDSPQTAQNIVQEHNMKHQLEHEGKVYTIPISMEDGSIEVRVHDLRPSVSHRQLAQRMREYGEILSLREEVWKDFFPGVPNGVRILRMKLTKPIPSYITVENCMTLVTYRGQVATCKHCNRNVHYTLKCSEYAQTLKVSVNDRLTMADVLKGVGKPPRTGAGTSQLKSNALNRSTTSLASDISSLDNMDADLPATDISESPEAPTTKNPTSEREQEPTTSSNTSEDQSISAGNNTAIQKTPVNMKRARSPLFIEPKNIEKRQSRSEVRSDRVDTRSQSRSKTETQPRTKPST